MTESSDERAGRLRAIVREQAEDRARQARATLSALAGILDWYGLGERFRPAVEEIAEAVHARHNEMAARA